MLRYNGPPEEAYRTKTQAATPQFSWQAEELKMKPRKLVLHQRATLWEFDQQIRGLFCISAKRWHPPSAERGTDVVQASLQRSLG